MTAATNYAGILRNVTLGQAGSFIGFMTLAASLFLVAFELKQGRDIAEAELMTQRYEMSNKLNGLYDLDLRLRREEVVRKLLKQGIGALSPEEILGDGEFGSQLKKRAAKIDCSQLPSPFFDERQKARR